MITVEVKFLVRHVIIKFTKKKLEGNINLLKREAPNELGFMCPILFVKNYLNKSSILICFFEKIFFILINSSLKSEWYNEEKSVNHC